MLRPLSGGRHMLEAGGRGVFFPQTGVGGWGLVQNEILLAPGWWVVGVGAVVGGGGVGG